MGSEVAHSIWAAFRGEKPSVRQEDAAAQLALANMLFIRSYLTKSCYDEACFGYVNDIGIGFDCTESASQIEFDYWFQDCAGCAWRTSKFLRHCFNLAIVANWPHLSTILEEHGLKGVIPRDATGDDLKSLLGPQCTCFFEQGDDLWMLGYSDISRRNYVANDCVVLHLDDLEPSMRAAAESVVESQLCQCALCQALRQAGPGFTTEESSQTTVGLDRVFSNHPVISFFGRSFLFTGELGSLTREQANQMVLQRGGRTLSSVTRQLDYLVVGSKASPLWEYTCGSNKVMKPIVFQRQGALSPTIIREVDFVAAAERFAAAP